MNHHLAIIARNTLQGVAILACAAGVGVWGAILLAPQPQAAPPALAVDGFVPDSMAPIAAWFGAGPALRVQIASSGLIAAGASSAAILSVDGATPRAYKVGQSLANDLVLAEVRPGSVIIRQGGQTTELQVPALPPITGIRFAR